MAEEIECTTKKWGGSLGVIIPKDIAEKEKIGPNEKVKVIITKTPIARSIWNLGPIEIKESAQDIKNEMRKGW